MRAQILSPWIGSGTDADQNRPLLNDVYPKADWTDVTEQPTENLHPDPNLYIVEVECDAATLAAIEADSRFLVLWSEE